jgi:hypothetical protein
MVSCLPSMHEDMGSTPNNTQTTTTKTVRQINRHMWLNDYETDRDWFSPVNNVLKITTVSHLTSLGIKHGMAEGDYVSVWVFRCGPKGFIFNKPHCDLRKRWLVLALWWISTSVRKCWSAECVCVCVCVCVCTWLCTSIFMCWKKVSHHIQ